MHTPFLPESAPFDEIQRQWLNGYLAGLLGGTMGNTGSTGTRPTAMIQSSPASRGSLLFAYGTQTGGAESLAKKFTKEAAKQGFDARPLSMADWETVDFSQEPRIAVIVSTYGDGEMPDNTQALWDHMSGPNAPRLDHVKFGVLALGDTNYPQFCEAGKKFDARLEALGGCRVIDRQECDTDYEEAATGWIKELLKVFSDELAPV